MCSHEIASPTELLFNRQWTDKIEVHIKGFTKFVKFLELTLLFRRRILCRICFLWQDHRADHHWREAPHEHTPRSLVGQSPPCTCRISSSQNYDQHPSKCISPFIHSGYFYSASLLLRGIPDYIIDTVSELTCQSATGNCEWRTSKRSLRGG